MSRRNIILEMMDCKAKSMSIAYSNKERFYYKRQANRLKKEYEEEKKKETVLSLQRW